MTHILIILFEIGTHEYKYILVHVLTLIAAFGPSNTGKYLLLFSN